MFSQAKHSSKGMTTGEHHKECYPVVPVFCITIYSSIIRKTMGTLKNGVKNNKLKEELKKIYLILTNKYKHYLGRGKQIL